MGKLKVSTLFIAAVISGVLMPIATAGTGAAQFGKVSVLPKTINILGRQLALRERQGGGMGQGAFASYIPAQEPDHNWTLLFGIAYKPGNDTPAAMAMNVVDKIKFLKASKKDPLATATMYESKDGKSANVDFMVSSTKPKLLEHNVFRYYKSPGGISSYQIARRIYGTPTNNAEVSQFLRDMPRMHNIMFQEVSRPGLPTWPN